MRGRLFVQSNVGFTTFNRSNTCLIYTNEIRSIAARVGLEDRLDDRPGSLPHADTRRLEMVKAIATAPESETLSTLQDDGMTVLLAEQNASFAMEHSDRLSLLEIGTVERSGTATEFRNDDYVRDAYTGVI